jgi:ribosome maturation factor RimP
MTLVGPFLFPGAGMNASKTRDTERTGSSSRNPPGARIVAEVTRLVAPILDATGLELDRIEQVMGGKKPVLRVFIDKQGGVCIDDCSEVSRQLSALLEDEEVIRGAFVIEVSSPGLDRPLHGEDDFRRFEGRLAHVHATSPIFGKRRDAVGRVAGVEDGCVLLDEVKSGERLRVPLDEIAKARLELEL